MKEFARVLSRLNQDEIEIFLEQILTRAEIQRITRRWELIRLLYEGVSQRAIASRLSISLCKVTRGSRELKRPDSVLSTILKNGYHLPRAAGHPCPRGTLPSGSQPRAAGHPCPRGTLPSGSQPRAAESARKTRKKS